MLTKIKNKNAAIELSIGTVVIIVLAMSMLVLGIVLIRNIFSGATDSVDEINEGVKSEIIKLFQDESERAVIRLSDNTAKIKQGEELGIAFGVKSIKQGTTSSETFTYETTLTNKGTCPIERDAESWILFGKGNMAVLPGKIEGKIIRFKVPDEAPLCTAEYRIVIWRPSEGESRTNPYTDLQFFIKVESSGIF